MKMDRFTIETRLREFSGPIQEIAMNNTCVADIIQQYAHGGIITREEALSQMVVQLAHDWSELSKEAYRLHQLSFVPPSRRE